jgi:predicted ATPase/DNA-binding SARP family transcriptional activator
VTRARLRVRVLGPLEVERDGARVGIAGGRLRALLACLALDAGRPVSTGRLAEALWETEPPADHVHALQSLVSRLRRALGDARLVTQSAGGYRLEAAVDADEFERLLAHGDPDGVRRALALWRGPALADLADYRFAAQAAARLEDLRLTALAERIAGDLQRGEGDRLVGELEALCDEHPLHERLAAQLIAALYAAGRQADALAAYERIRRRLADELGVPPSRELQQAHLAVLQGEPAARRSVRSNLPAPVTSFVGRERELAQIDDLLARSRLVTLLGPGGAGKTRLAREAGARWLERVADGVWLVELAPVSDPSEMVPAVLGALGLREATLPERTAPTPPREGLERLLDVLADREAILVLDNCEHLIAGAAQLAATLLGACPRLRIVATSREALAIEGESLVAVPPLDESPAVELFGDRAAAARPGFVVDDAAVEICRRLDGLPLALELAAARLRTLPAHEIAARLDDRFRLLTGGSRTALPRHRTLRAVVDWSWDLLDEPERRLARRLAVLSAGATVESASAVDEGDALEGLAALTERSLLQVVPDSTPTRYRMLETIREYGLERLAEADELEPTRTRAAHYFADLVHDADPRLRRPGQQRWYALLDAERENIVAALRHLGETGEARRALRLAIDLLWFWLLSGGQEEAAAWLRFGLAVPGEPDPDDRLIAEGVLAAEALGRASDSDEVRRTMGEVAARVRDLDDGERPLLAVGRIVVEFFAGDDDRRRAAEAHGLAHPDPWVHAAIRLIRAGMAENAGDVETMGAELGRAQAEFERVGDAWGVAMTLFIESGRLMLASDLEGAERALTQARAALATLGRDAAGGMLDVRFADLRLRRGDLDGARRYAADARERRDLGGDDMSFLEATVARIAWLSGDVELAERELREARERIARRGPSLPQSGHGRALVEGLSAVLAAERGDSAEADARLAAAYAAGLGTDDMPLVSAVAISAAAIAHARGDAAATAELLSAAAAIRGADDLTNPEISRLPPERGPALSREAALERLQRAASGAAPVRP